MKIKVYIGCSTLPRTPCMLYIEISAENPCILALLDLYNNTVQCICHPIPHSSDSLPSLKTQYAFGNLHR